MSIGNAPLYMCTAGNLVPQLDSQMRQQRKVHKHRLVLIAIIIIIWVVLVKLESTFGIRNALLQVVLVWAIARPGDGRTGRSQIEISRCVIVCVGLV
jgi:amino acid permease